MRNRNLTIFSLAAWCSYAASVTPAGAAEHPVGTPVKEQGLEISAVYLQPIEMAPPGMMRPAAETDIHLEADIHATQGNQTGFANGDWLPDLVVTYDLVKSGGTEHISGVLMPMVANDGPHYGDNVKLSGPGKYTLTLTVKPPEHFGRHTDKETGVGPWFTPVVHSFDFAYAGVGKKGGY